MKTKLSLGILLIVLAELSFTLMWFSVKLGGETLPIFQIAFFRGLVAIVSIGSAMIIRGTTFKVKNKRVLLGRCVAGYIGMILAFTAITKIGMGNTVTLHHTTPIFVALLSPFLLKEKSKKSLLAWIIIAFVGIIFILKPDQNIFQNYSTLALLAGFFAAIAYMAIRHLHLTDHTMGIAFYFSVFICIASFPLMITSFETPTTMGWLALIGTGIFGTLGQLLITYGYKCGPANIMTPFNNSAILFSFLLGWIYWREIPDIFSAAGATLIIISIVAISLIANRKQIPKDLPRIGES